MYQNQHLCCDTVSYSKKVLSLRYQIGKPTSSVAKENKFTTSTAAASSSTNVMTSSTTTTTSEVHAPPPEHVPLQVILLILTREKSQLVLHKGNYHCSADVLFDSLGFGQTRKSFFGQAITRCLSTTPHPMNRAGRQYTSSIHSSYITL